MSCLTLSVRSVMEPMTAATASSWVRPDVAHGLGLRAQLPGCGGALFGVGRRHGCDLVHLRHGPGDLCQTLCLFLAGLIDLVDELLDLECAFGDGADDGCHGVELGAAGMACVDGGGDQFGGIAADPRSEERRVEKE